MQYCKVESNALQYNTAQYSTVQYRAVNSPICSSSLWSFLAFVLSPNYRISDRKGLFSTHFTAVPIRFGKTFFLNPAYGRTLDLSSGENSSTDINKSHKMFTISQSTSSSYAIKNWMCLSAVACHVCGESWCFWNRVD